ncbi:MAG: tetratricopeptide repeat protein [Holophagaceae bacterium]|nr:tetratricopeptide repeat protein [Holophagaceae bacterium]
MWIGVALGLVVGVPLGWYLKPAPPAPAAGTTAQGLPAGFPVAGQPGQAAPGLPPGAGLPAAGGLPAGMGMPMGAGPGTAPAPVPTPQQAARIFEMEQIVAREPGNALAWIQLGNDYFDSHQAAKSIAAYGKALAIDPKNPDVLTDQGVMYRQTGEFQKAIANFEKAVRLDPKHAQSQYNIGIVYSEDLKQPDKAIKAWTQLMQSNPGSPQAEQARHAIEAVKAKRP